MPKTISIPGFIDAQRAESYEKPHWNGYCFTWRDYDVSTLGAPYIKVARHVLEFEIPDGWNPVPEEIAALEAKRTEVLVEAQTKLNAINDLIGKLSALTFEPAGETV